MKKLDENIQNYRQPMVTSTGIILGFVLGVTGKWATDIPQKTDVTDYLVGVGLFTGIILLIIVMHRALDNSNHLANPGVYYQKTLRLFTAGLCCSFFGVFVSIFQILLSN